ncbi:zf-MYND and/or SET domain containing protein [Asbolus verrucosus]|uniref:Zf-MYND and/or SET domain containing protein n=1 Tax=Asbolus verrucosus TaxID=1661398 RepID=A0A482VL13_ASBVE|nr:zf-MYND and/or SET domain containing protein [Asbolus verrucosus]
MTMFSPRQDINRALSNNYPEHLKRSLIDRREKLLALAGAAGDASGHHEPPPPLPDERNPEFEAAAACVELKLTGESKRRVFATRDIHVGEVISVERPFSFTLAAADLYHCHDCFELCYNPIPCDSCSQSLYCGEACKVSAWDKYHKYECPILISLKNIVGKHKAFLLAVKMSFLIEDESQASDVYKLTENLDKEHIRDELFTTALVTALMFHLVKKYTTKFEGATRQAEEKFKELLMLHLRICLIHAAGIDELCPNVIDGEHRLLNFRSETVGCALFPFYSFLGHACCPNVFAHHHGVTRVLRAIRTIRKGQECLVSYGPYYIEHNKADRQSRLLSQYHLTCKCRACVDDWPQLDLLPYQVTSQEDYAFLGDIRNASVDVAKSSIHRFIDGVRYFEDLEPYMDLTLQQKMLSYCYDVLGNKRQVL